MKKLLALLLIALSVWSPTVSVSAVRPPAETWAFCGVHPADPYAQRKANALAASGGIDATFGPCMPPNWSTYSPAFPGQRYIDPTGYLYLTVINANAGMKTIVYDARIWSDDPATRNAAIEFWRPHIAWVRAFDMGDEFDPNGPEWSVLVHRWQVMMAYVVPQLGVGPFSNHLPWAIDPALASMPEHVYHLSFDEYNINSALWLADHFNLRVNHLMCAVNALNHSWVTSATKIKSDMRSLRNYGCDSFLIFGGVNPYSTVPNYDPNFGTYSLVTKNGTATSWATAVLQGSTL